MSQVHLKVKDVGEFFIELHSRCKHKKCYSLLATIEQMAVTGDEVMKWAKSDENWMYTVELCLQLCLLHIQDAELSGDLSEDMACNYCKENRSLLNL